MNGTSDGDVSQRTSATATPECSPLYTPQEPLETRRLSENTPPGPAESSRHIPLGSYTDDPAANARHSADIADMITELQPNANTLLANLNDRVVELKTTLDRVNDLLNDENRKNIGGTVANLNGMLAENRANLKHTLNNVNAMSDKLNPLIDNFNKTATQANQTLSHVDEMIGEDRPDLKKAIANLRVSLDQAVNITSQLNATLNTNAENLDEIIDNLRHITDNMNEFTETIKTRPYTLIRASGLPARQPGQAPPK